MAISYLESLLIVVGVCLGLRTITDDGMIGSPIRMWAITLPEWIGKPLITCVTCMSSLWGTIVFFSIYYNVFVFNFK
jgi:hypothetical protein